MGWLRAVPKPDPRSRRAKAKDQPKPVSRLEKMKAGGVKHPPMPPNPAPHIIDRLMEIGLVESNGMGSAPLSWREINEWQRATGVDLPPWEARLIRRLSTEYLSELHQAEDESRPAPWAAPVTQAEIATEADRLRALVFE